MPTEIRMWKQHWEEQPGSEELLLPQRFFVLFLKILIST